MARPGLKLLDLGKARVILDQQRRDCFDVYAPLSKVRLELGDTLGASARERYRFRLEGGTYDKQAELSAVAFSQLGNIVGAPPAHLERLPASLGLKTVRCLLEMEREANDRTFLFRFQNRERPQLRACLPASWVRFDDRDVYEQFFDIAGQTGAKITNLTVNDEIFALRTAFPKELDLGAGRVRDMAYPGVEILSSEVGVHTLTCRVVLYREVCRNGMTSVSEAQEHLNVRNTRLRPDAFRIAAKAAIQESMHFGEKAARGLRESRDDYAKDPLKEIETIFQRYAGLGSPRGRHARWVLDEIQHKYSLFGVSRFDILNAITAVSQRLEHRRRLCWEDAAGAYLFSLMNNKN